MDKMTLLDMVQNILSSMDSDEVNSINDTMESEQVATIIKETYRAKLSNRNWPFTRRLIKLDASGDASLPTHMKLIDEVKQISFVKYDKATAAQSPRRVYQDVRWLEPDDFLRLSNGLDNTKSTVQTVIDPVSSIPLSIRNDKAPEYFTSFDDKTLVFDSYDSTQDQTLVNSKTQVYGYVFPQWQQVDDFVPDLPSDAFTLLLEESKSRAFVELKQIANNKAEQESQRQNAWLSRKDKRIHGGIKFPDYGR